MDKSDIFDIKMVLWMILSVISTNTVLSVIAGLFTLVYAALTLNAIYKENKQEKVNETIQT